MENVLNVGNRFNVWSKVCLKHPLTVTDGNQKFQINNGTLGYVVKAEPLTVEFYDSGHILELEPESLMEVTPHG
jgi:hypothetical protein